MRNLFRRLPSVADLARYAALGAAMVISWAVQRDLALSHGIPAPVAPAVPVAIDLYLVWAVRTGRDVALAVGLSTAANVAGVLTTEPLTAVATWVSAGLHAAFPVAVWRMHRAESDLEPQEAMDGQEEATEGPLTTMAIQADTMTTTEADTASTESPVATPLDIREDVLAVKVDTAPSLEDIQAAVRVLASRHDRPVTGALLADHFGVSARTGRRYLAAVGVTQRTPASLSA
ncbi:transfer protein spdA [Streptomyces sp. WAC 05379]|uniref:transfer protein spdA n=1 Tax=Streptomyces sp. WAC 05379 TaxID=2203207 RepID=UPI000F743FCF|nr:transfer protein spdA [Streptomyces sp. WAC 05379]RSN89937.1 transfer protein spdA [Streptomyces sp. WAC 05379]